MTGPARVPPGRHPDRPVHRYPPRSHAWNCPCPRCVQCRSQKTVGSGLIGFDLGCLAVILAFAGIGALIGWLVHAWHGRLAIALGALVLAGVAVMIVRSFTWLREDDRPPAVPPAMPPEPPLPRPRKAAQGSLSSLPPPPPSVCVQPPACQHPNAVEVPDLLGARIAWLCPDPPDGCGAQLGPGERSGELKPHAGWPPVRRVQREDD